MKNEYKKHDDMYLKGELYGLLIRLQENWEEEDTNEHLEEYCKRKTLELFPETFDMVREDARFVTMDGKVYKSLNDMHTKTGSYVDETGFDWAEHYS